MKTKNIRIKIILLVCVLLLLFIGYLFLSSPSKYRVDTPLKKELVSFWKSNSLPTTKGGNNDGFCPPPGCGPNASVSREDIKLELTDEQLTALVNTLKPKNVLASDIRIKFDSGKIISAGISYYPLFPGNITVISNLRLNHFYVEEVYIGGIQASGKTESFIEANGSSLIDRAFQESGVFLKSMRIEGDRFIFEASVPKGMIKVEDGVIKINQSPTQNDADPIPTGNTRF